VFSQKTSQQRSNETDDIQQKTNNDGGSIVPSSPSMGTTTIIRVVVRRRFPPRDVRMVGVVDGDGDGGGRTTSSRGGRRRRITGRRSLSAVPGAVDYPERWVVNRVDGERERSTSRACARRRVLPRPTSECHISLVCPYIRISIHPSLLRKQQPASASSRARRSGRAR